MMIKNPFKTASNAIPKYGSAPPSPFLKAGEVWDRRMGEPTRQKANWQRAFFGVLVLAGASSGTLAYREIYAPVPAYAVPVSEHGLLVGKSILMSNARYVPSRQQVAADISRWVVLVRSRPADGYTLGANMRLAKSFMSAEGVALLNAHNEKFDPFEHYRLSKDQSSKVTVIVSGPEDNPDKSVATYPRVTQLEGNSYHVEWREVRWDHGTASQPYQMSMTVRATAEGQKDEQKMDVNPGGTAISWWDWRGKPVS